MRKILIILLAGLLAIQILYVAFGIVQNPLPTGDAYGIWFLKAKAISQSRDLYDFQVFLKDSAFSYDHPEYPILWPTLLALFGNNISEWMRIYPLIFAGIVFLTFLAVKEKSNTLNGLLAAFAVSSVIVIERQGGRGEVGFADLPLALAFLVCYWMYLRREVCWPALGLALGVAANMKLEGALGAIIFALMVRPRNKSFWLILIPLLMLWPLVSRYFQLTNIYQSNFSFDFIFGHLNRLWIITGLAIREVLSIKSYGLWLIIFILSSSMRSETKMKKMIIWVYLYLVCLAGSYFFTPLEMADHWHSSFYRLVSGILPVIIANSFIMASLPTNRQLKNDFHQIDKNCRYLRAGK